MKIKMLSLMAGPTGARHPGQICTVGVDIEAAEAKQLIGGGYAEEVGDNVQAKPVRVAKGKGAGATAPAEAEADALQGLFGSSVQPAVLKAPGGKEVSLGDIVRPAFEASGLTAVAWNALPEAEREQLVAAQVEKFMAENPAAE